jgi:hypothetical protein
MAPEAGADIVVVSSRIDPAELRRLVEHSFGDMVKFVVDLEARLAAIGGELHADAEARLLATGSRQADLWGANYYPGRSPEDCVEYVSLINIRPAQGNRGMRIESAQLRARVLALAHALIGRGEELA